VGLMDIVRGPRCDMCGRRSDTVGKRPETGLTLCTKCSKGLKAADRSKPYGSAAVGYRAGTGQPPKLAGPMGSGYRGPTPPAQRRR
jgi:hypothetical protein